MSDKTEILVEKGTERKFVTPAELAACLQDNWIELGRKLTPEIPVPQPKGKAAEASKPADDAGKPKPEGKGKGKGKDGDQAEGGRAVG